MIDVAELNDLSVEDKRELLKGLLNLRPGSGRAAVPLSHGQQSLWFVYQLAPTSPAYNFLYAARIRTPVEPSAFVQACRSLVRRHQALRTRFVVQDHRPMQLVDDSLTIDVPITDATAWSEERLHEVLQQRADRPFDLERGPALRIELFRRPGGESVLLLAFHHIIADLWSMDLLVQELHKLYAAERLGHRADLAPLPAQFADFVRWQLLSVHGPRGQKSRAFWQEALSGELPVLNLPTDRPRPPVQTYNGTCYSWKLDPAMVRRVRALAAENQATPFMVLLAVFQLLLHRLSGQDDILVGTTVADRARPEWEPLVGFFLNQVVLRADFTADLSFREQIIQTRDRVYQALEHQDYPFGQLVKHLQPPRDPSRSPIFQVMFIWDKTRELGLPEAVNGTGLRLETVRMEQRGAPFDLTLIVFETGETLTASFRYNTDLFDAAPIERMAGYLNTLLEGLAASPDAPMGEVSLLPATERHRILAEWNRTDTAYPHDCCFHHLFEKSVERSPEEPALYFGDTVLPYRDLNERANQLARHLQTMGVHRGDVVAISLPRGVDAVITILAAWKAGAAYLYLDPSYPVRRLAGMVADSRPAVLVAPAINPDLALPTVRLSDDWPSIFRHSAANLDVPVTPDDKAYIIYTSGSTGKPKGTVLRHGGLCNMSEAQRQVFAVEPHDRVLQFASLGFDASVFEIAMALRSGASLVLTSLSDVLAGPALGLLIREKGVTNATLPPSVLAMIPPEPPLPSLRTLIVAGEACSAQLVATWAPGRHFFNAYGPTEATVWSTVSECHPGRAPTIGRPIANTRAYVLDRHLQPVPVGVSGELYVAGPGMAVGYVNEPGLTAERFLPNPFDPSFGSVMYHTGDLARWLPNGELEFLGRCDHQVKMHGYRIEMEEIQEVLRQHPDVADAVVSVRATKESDTSLEAYVVPRAPATFAASAVRAYLRERLPHYMIPSHLIPIAALPLSNNGKVDRSRLPRERGTDDFVERECQARPHATTAGPRTGAEQLLAEVWAHVLKVEHVGIHDNFFDLGGASIQTLEVVELANARGLSLTPEMLFRYQTVAELASACGLAEGSANPLPQTTVSPATAAPRPSINGHHSDTKAAPTGGALVESIGVYLPARSVTTDQVLKGCRNRLDFPLERLTGIRSRRVADAHEFSIDLATQAAAECLRRSSHRPEDIDLLICCNISHCDGPDYRFTLEPTTAARICQRFGLVNAVAFDLTNACAGTFTSLLVIDAFLRAGAIRRAMVVSGEYITHLTQTAQQEIEGFMDPRLACLTLGDSGMALIVERAPKPDIGFQEIELYTLGKYHDLCVAKVTKQLHGGAIMYTDPVKSAAVTIQQAVSHAVEVLRRKQCPPEAVKSLIMHQTSETTLDGAMREINRAFGKEACSRANTVYNIAERGNTATNTHFLAVWERIQAGEYRPGDRLLFAVSGSGQTVGTALYHMDQLPERMRQPVMQPAVVQSRPVAPIRSYHCSRRVRVESIGIAGGPPADSVSMLRQAGEACLRQSARPREEIEVVIHTGVHRSEFLGEPAMAAIAAGELNINADEAAAGVRRTLAFDLANGAAGTLTACLVASQLFAARKFSRALILASEVDHNREVWPENRLGLKETASALVLEAFEGSEGFAAFGFRVFPEYVEAIISHTGEHAGWPAVYCHRDPAIDARILECVRLTVGEFLKSEGLTLAGISRVILPQRSREFGTVLAGALELSPTQPVFLDGDEDYFTSSLAYSFARLREEGQLSAGSPILIVEVAAGLQVGCALYHA